MESLGHENEELSGKVTNLENEKISLEDKLVELKVEAKHLRKKYKEKEAKSHLFYNVNFLFFFEAILQYTNRMKGVIVLHLVMLEL